MEKPDSIKIKVAKKAGFCFGVKRAVNIAYSASSDKNSPVFTLGPLIHNPQVVNDLEEKGIKVIENPAEVIPKSKVIIRSHGISVETLKILKDKNVELIDATCPFVKRAQDIVKTLAEKNYWVVIIGDKEHPEVKALLSYGGEKASIYPVYPKNVSKIAIVSQTTQEFDAFIEKSYRLMLELKNFEETRIFNTVCQSTSERQKECKELAQQVDLMIVVGGKNSANTKRLVEISLKEGKKTYHIETKEEIDKAWLEGAKMIGVTAGASTPDWIIDSVIERLRKLTGGIVEDGRTQKL